MFKKLRNFLKKRQNLNLDENDKNDEKNIMYYSTDKDKFIKTQIPSHMKIITRPNTISFDVYNSPEEDYNIEMYYSSNNKHLSDDSYFPNCPKIILDYKKKLQETGLIPLNVVQSSDMNIENDLIDEYMKMDDFEDKVMEVDPYIKDYFMVDNNEEKNNYVRKFIQNHEIMEEYKKRDIENWKDVRDKLKNDLYTNYLD